MSSFAFCCPCPPSALSQMPVVQAAQFSSDFVFRPNWRARRFCARGRSPTNGPRAGSKHVSYGLKMCNPSDSKAESADMDIIERVYTMIFGKKEKEPFGLKRFDRDRFPELYPATLDEFADILPCDTPEIATFRPLLARTQLQSRELQLLYDANRDGYCSETFHERVNRKGACVVLGRTKKAVFGGYNPKGFVGYGESRGSKAAFLFSWPDGDTSKPAQKMRKVGGVALAVVDQPDTGPKFGADSLVAPLRAPGGQPDGERDRMAYSKLGSYYERRPDGSNSLFGEGESGKGERLEELKVYAVVYAEGEEIPFNDALPFSLE